MPREIGVGFNWNISVCFRSRLGTCCSGLTKSMSTGLVPKKVRLILYAKGNITSLSVARALAQSNSSELLILLVKFNSLVVFNVSQHCCGKIILAKITWHEHWLPCRYSEHFFAFPFRTNNPSKNFFLFIQSKGKKFQRTT